MTCGGPGCTDTQRTPLVFLLRTRKRLIDARFNVALRLPAHGRQLGDNEVT